jgi:hypothetical protein
MNIKKIITRSLLAAGAVVALTMPVVGTLDANASTGGCTAGVYAGYCSTEVSTDSAPLAFDSFRQGSKVGTPIIGFVNSDTDKATDFFTFQPGTTQDQNTKFFEYAPNGVASNLCISEPAVGAGLVLRVCNGSKWQQFTASPVTGGFTWTNSATKDVVTTTGKSGGQLKGVALVGNPTASEVFNFAG